MAIQSLGTAASSRPSPPDRNDSGSAVVANRSSGQSRTGAANGAANVQNIQQASNIETQNAVRKTDEAPSLEQVNQAVQNINKSLQSLNQNLEFSVDTDSKRTVVKVVDQSTKEVIRQIPSEETLEIAKALDTVKGLLIKQQA